MDSIPIYEWVNGNNPPQESHWKKGFWDYVEFLYRLKDGFVAAEMSVVDSYAWETPNPKENIVLPVFSLSRDNTIMVGRNCMLLHPYYLVSVQSESPIPDDFGISSVRANGRTHPDSGIPRELLFESFQAGCKRFTGLVGDEYDVYALTTIIFGHEKQA